MNMELLDKKHNKSQIKIEEMTKEQIRQAILKKRECTAKAQGIVESLLEKDISEDYFVQCLPDINQSHFEDIVEERAIVHLCGYPICSKSISERNIPKQKYRISIKTNKVYDITARKSFCSNSCYKSSMHVKKQMLTSPLWFREYDKVPKFHLLPLDAVGSLGQEVDVALIKRVNIQPPVNTFTSIVDFASASLHELTGADQCEDENNKIANKEDSKIETQSDIDNTENLQINQNNNVDDKTVQQTKNSIQESQNVESILDKSINTSINRCEIQKRPIPNPLNIVGEVIEKPERKIDPIITQTPNSKMGLEQSSLAKKLSQKKQPSVTVIAIEVETSLAEWFTLDTLIFLFGEEKVKEMVSDKGECIKEYLNHYAKSIFYNSNTYDQYQALCKKLNMLELGDRRNDTQVFLQRESKPLPEYSTLQEESKNMQLKVKAYYTGETVIPNININYEKVTNEEDNLTQIPLVDKNAQNAIRRKIVGQHLNKALPDLLRSLGLLSLAINSDVHLLVNTFKLKANNIMFKPIQWTLIAIIVIRLLSLRNKRLECMLQSPTAYQHMQLLLLSYNQDGGYFDRLISWLTDIDRLLDTNDTQLTVG